MSLITGYIALVCFLMLVVKYLLRKLGFHKANAFMMKLHEGASAGLFLVGIVHIIFASKKFADHTPALGIAGIALFALCIVLIAACHMTKDVKRKMRDHRWLSLACTIALVVHVVLYWI